MTTILHRVNSEVSQKEAFIHPGEQKQMPEVRFTLRKRLVLSPRTAWRPCNLTTFIGASFFCNSGKCVQVILKVENSFYVEDALKL